MQVSRRRAEPRRELLQRHAAAFAPESIYVVILLCVAGAVIGIWWPDHVATAASNLTNLLQAIPESLWWLFGAGYLGYTGSRSFDKWKAAGR